MHNAAVQPRYFDVVFRFPDSPEPGVLTKMSEDQLFYH